ncbi:MAG: uncharacterized protein KVP18_001013 [Porospora cf. gigantea A]|nr:MAG: hypothetical protein KVP18_001013 [Porospora cf. gigantea A]
MGLCRLVIDGQVLRSEALKKALAQTLRQLCEAQGLFEDQNRRPRADEEDNAADMDHLDVTFNKLRGVEGVVPHLLAMSASWKEDLKQVVSSPTFQTNPDFASLSRILC